jgi:acyl dehydratase
MPLDPDAVGYVSEAVVQSWASTDSLRYALGIGAGADELAYTTENSRGVAQRAYPTQVVTLGTPARAAWKALGSFDWAKLVHGGQDIELHRPLPTEGRISTVTEVAGIYDKGKAAIVEFVIRSSDADTADPMFTTRWRLFIRGEGGFGDRGTPPAPLPPLDGPPDGSFSASTTRDQALIYRLSGDRNPLHSDPAFAKRAGFERPILHGLCTYGVTGRVLLRELCDDDPTRFGAMSARFSSPVYPGDELIVDLWRSGDGDRFQTRRADGEVVLADGLLTLRAAD